MLQTTTCTPKDIYMEIQGWTTAFEVELFSFITLDVKIDVREETLDLRKVTILPGKAVMVKKPNGDGTQKKKARVVVCGNFQQVQPGEETCANTPSFPMLRVKGHSGSSSVAYCPVGGWGHTEMYAELETAVPSPQHPVQ